MTLRGLIRGSKSVRIGRRVGRSLLVVLGIVGFSRLPVVCVPFRTGGFYMVTGDSCFREVIQIHGRVICLDHRLEK